MPDSDGATPSQATQDLLPPVALSIADDLAVVILEPFARELTATEKAGILAAKRVRVFIDGRATVKLSRSVSAPIQLADYPADTLQFCIQHANLICVGVVDRRKETTTDEIESLLRDFDGEDVEDCRFVVRMVTDVSFDVGEYSAMHRPNVPFRIASAFSADAEQNKAAV